MCPAPPPPPLLLQSTVFCCQAGDWKLGGFELTADPRALGPAAWSGPRALLPRRAQPPELQRSQFAILEQAHVGVLDAWLLGVAIFEVRAGRCGPAARATGEGCAWVR